MTSPNLDRRHAGRDGAGRKANSKAVAGETDRIDVVAQTLSLMTSDAAPPYGSGRIGRMLSAMLDSTLFWDPVEHQLVQVTARVIVEGDRLIL